MIDATFSKFLKRYLLVPNHSNNAIIYHLTSTIPLSTRLKRAAPNSLQALSFPSILHGHNLSFFPQPSQEMDRVDIPEQIPSTFWLSRMVFTIPLRRKVRRRLFRDILDTDHHIMCKTTSFHPHSLPSCICVHCGEHAHAYHARFCTETSL